MTKKINKTKQTLTFKAYKTSCKVITTNHNWFEYEFQPRQRPQCYTTIILRALKWKSIPRAIEHGRAGIVASEFEKTVKVIIKHKTTLFISAIVANKDPDEAAFPTRTE